MKHCRMRIFNTHVIYGAVICNSALAIHSFKVKQNVGLFLFCSSCAVKC